MILFAAFTFLLFFVLKKHAQQQEIGKIYSCIFLSLLVLDTLLVVVGNHILNECMEVALLWIMYY
jgi:hypothetical protein